MSANDDILDKIIREIRDPTARHRSEIAYKKTHWGGAHRERSRKNLQKAYWGQHRGPHARREIESQVADIDPEADKFLSTDTIANLVPIGKEAFDGLDIEEFLQDPVTGQSHRLSKQTLYLSQLAREIVHGDSDMSSDDIEKLANLSPEFDSSLQDAYDDSYGIGRFRDDYGDDDLAYLTEDRRYDNGITRRIADRFNSADVRAYFLAGSDNRQGTVSKRNNSSGKRLLGEGLSDDLEEGAAAMLTEIILSGFQSLHTVELNEFQMENLGRSLRYHMHKKPELPRIILSELEYARIEDEGMGAPGEHGYLDDENLSFGSLGPRDDDTDYYDALEGDEWRED